MPTDRSPPTPSLVDLIDAIPAVEIVDIGANPIAGEPPYAGLLRRGQARLTGFEPNREALAELAQQKRANETYLPYVIGDGAVHEFKLCRASGMSSILEPNRALLDYFHGFPEWSTVEKRERTPTVRLDDVREIASLDYLKIDVQGAELMVFRNAPRLLKQCLVIHTEVEFLPMYVDQPLFADVESFLRGQGFVFHRFAYTASRAIKPLLVDNSVYSEFSQIFWADAVFIRDFTRLSELDGPQLLKFARLLHDVYQSYDVVLRTLMEHDRRFSTTHADRFYARITGQSGGSLAPRP